MNTDLPPGATRHGRRFASPLSRALARREGLDLSNLTGSGPEGRILRADVMAALAALPSASQDVQATAPGMPPFDAFPNSFSRKLLARRLSDSMQQLPHFYVRIECNVDALLALRHAGAANRKLSINDFVIKAAALALKAVPGVNASYTDASIRRYSEVNIAVAVALEDGLLTPVIRHADEKTVFAIAAEVAALAEAARAGRLKAGASGGGTFSISSLGAYGVREFTAVINPPQGAILAVGAAEPRAVVVDGQLAIATMMTVTLSADHRAIDGALAARWLQSFRQHIEHLREEDIGSPSSSAP